jgi:hypothetical protein
MPAAKQIAANRLNSQKAAGARTAEGKAASRFNALKHGVYAGHHEQYRPSIPTGASSPTLFTTNGVSPAFASFRDFSRTPSPNAPQSPLCAASASPRRRTLAFGTNPARSGIKNLGSNSPAPLVIFRPQPQQAKPTSTSSASFHGLFTNPPLPPNPTARCWPGCLAACPPERPAKSPLRGLCVSASKTPASGTPPHPQLRSTVYSQTPAPPATQLPVAGPDASPLPARIPRKVLSSPRLSVEEPRFWNQTQPQAESRM